MSYYATFNNFTKSLIMTKPVLGCEASIKINILCNYLALLVCSVVEPMPYILSYHSSTLKHMCHTVLCVARRV